MAASPRRTLALLTLSVATVSCVSTRAEPVTITIENFAFSAPSRPIRAGDTVTWTNKDIVDHAATGKAIEFDAPVAVDASVSVTMAKAGPIDYYCKFHPNMTARLDVAP